MTAVVVLGLHCGGTSAVAGVLHHLGVHMGDELLGPSYNNPKGHFEDAEFVRLHDQMIGDWKYPEKIGAWRLCEEYRSLIADRASRHHLWGVKDPRMVWCFLLFQYYASLIPVKVKVIEVYRKPSVVAQSLFFRGGHTPFEALDITLRYNEQKMSLRGANTEDGVPWLIVRYDDLVSLRIGELTEIKQFLERDEPPEIWKDYRGITDKMFWDAFDFIDPSLRHWQEQETQ